MKKLLTNLSHLAKDKKAWLALIAGLFLTLSYAPSNLWFITFLSLGALLYCINPLANGKLAAKQSAKYGFLFGLGWFGAGISWVHVSIATFGGMPLIASLSLMVLLCAYLALYPALATWLTTRLATGPYSFICWLLAAIATTEYLRGTLLTGFPWLSFGYTQTDSPLNFLAPVIGEFGITLVCMLIAFALYRLASKDGKPLIASVALLAGLYTIASSNQLHYQDKTIKTVLVQGNIKQHLRFEPSEFWTTMSKYQDMTRLHWNAELIVWPEAAVPELEALSTEYLTGLDSAATFNDTALITGIVDYQYDTRNIFNTLIVLGKKEHNDSEGHYQYLGKNRYQKHQ
ncbi:MAG: nitrilase-related carbon-nitrogen hydrolase, partial [Pseudomonadota bacterium]|nr:nitrilase-related carbon-nitrogen hydrolase [Pseudomonadota bacterium]